VYVYEPEDERWRLLALAEQRAMWDRRKPAQPAGVSSAV